MSTSRKLSDLHPYPDPVFELAFRPEACVTVQKAIKERRTYNPVVIREEGTILSGHVTYLTLKALNQDTVTVQVHSAFPTPTRELEYVYSKHAEYFTNRQLAIAYTTLCDTGKVSGAYIAKRGPKPTKRRPGTKEFWSRTLGLSEATAEALRVIYLTPGVPASLIRRVDSRNTSIQLAAEAIDYAAHEAYRIGIQELDPVDIEVYIQYPKMPKGTRATDLIRGAKPRELGPVTVEGVAIPPPLKVRQTLPAPFAPKQLVHDMIIRGVDYSGHTLTDSLVPLHGVIALLRERLVEAFGQSTTRNDARIVQELEALAEKCANYLQLLGKEPSAPAQLKAKKKPVLPPPAARLAAVIPREPSPVVRYPTDTEYVASLLGLS